MYAVNKVEARGAPEAGPVGVDLPASGTDFWKAKVGHRRPDQPEVFGYSGEDVRQGACPVDSMLPVFFRGRIAL